jgi:hypothetical protein
VLVVEVDDVDLQAAEAGLGAGPHVLRPAVDDPATVRRVRERELGGQLNLVAAPGQRLADQFLVVAGAVDVGGIEEGDAEVEGARDGGQRLLAVGGAVHLAHPHAAQAEGRDDEAVAEGAGSDR